MTKFDEKVRVGHWGLLHGTKNFFPAVRTLRAFGAQALTVFNHF